MVNKVCMLVLMISTMMLSSAVYARDLGVVGKLYPIQERDALEELESRAAKVDWKKKLGKIKPEKYRPENSVSLPRASKSSVRLVDVTYVLDIDVPDGKGGVVYPKGYSFNPLDYVPFRRTIVVINAQDHEQVAWFKSSEYAKRIDVMLLITEGGYLEVSKSLNRPIFYADTRIAEKFQIHSVPAIVRQSGRMMEVTDVYIPKTAKSRGL